MVVACTSETWVSSIFGCCVLAVCLAFVARLMHIYLNIVVAVGVTGNNKLIQSYHFNCVNVRSHFD